MAELLSRFPGVEKPGEYSFLQAVKTLSSEVQVALSGEEQKEFSTGETLLLSFCVFSPRYAEITVTVEKDEKIEMTYPVPAQWTRVRMPFCGSGLVALAFSATLPVEIADVTLENRGNVPVTALDAESGMLLLEQVRRIRLMPEDAADPLGAKDLVKSGDFVYTIGGGSLCVINVRDPAHPKRVALLSDLGTSSIRQIAVSQSGRELFITSRENGMFVVDVSDPYHPYRLATYNSIEMATGLAVSGTLAFICNRVYGVEIVDVSDPASPRLLSIVRNGEVQSCAVWGNILYCGLWAQCRVDLVDISDPEAPVFLRSLPLSGKGDGLSLLEKDGRLFLYAATGQHTVGKPGKDTADLCFGQGGGMDIFDVTEPLSPVHLSAVKLDGRFYFANNDNWETAVSCDENGRVLVYLSNTHNGAFVYDATDPAAPKRVLQIETVIPKSSPLYQFYTSPIRYYVFPYDQAKEEHSAVSALLAENGVLYLTSIKTGLFALQDGELFFKGKEPPVNPVPAPFTGRYFDFDASAFPHFRRLSGLGQVYSIDRWNEVYFCACGSCGITAVNEDLEILYSVPLDDICYELQIRGDRLYASCGQQGLRVYRIKDGGLDFLWNYRSPTGLCRGCVLSRTGRFIGLQISANTFEIIDSRTRVRLVSKKPAAQMYHRNLLSFENGRYLGFWGNSVAETWFDCGENDEKAVPETVNVIDKTCLFSCGSAVEVNGRLYASSGNGFSLYHPLSSDKIDKIPLEKGVWGMPVVNGDLLVLSDRRNGKVHFFDFADPAFPKRLQSISVAGNPDRALITEKHVFLPMGYQGVFRFDKAALFKASGKEKEREE